MARQPVREASRALVQQQLFVMRNVFMTVGKQVPNDNCAVKSFL